MNIAQHMEAIFVAATVALCAISYTPETEVKQELASQAADSSAQVQTVVIVAKRV